MWRKVAGIQHFEKINAAVQKLAAVSPTDMAGVVPAVPIISHGVIPIARTSPAMTP
jgi:hypothetical protein